MKWEGCRKHFCWVPKYDGGLEANSSVIELRAKIAPLFCETAFFLEEIADKLHLLRLGYLADIFTKMMQVSLSLQRKQVIVSIRNQFGKTCTFPLLERFLDEIGGNIN